MSAETKSTGVTCDCRKDIEQKLTKRYAEQVPEASNHQVSLQGYGFALADNTLVMRCVMAYEATATHCLKGGGTKQKKLKGSMTFNYCPFCGKSAA